MNLDIAESSTIFSAKTQSFAFPMNSSDGWARESLSNLSKARGATLRRFREYGVGLSVTEGIEIGIA